MTGIFTNRTEQKNLDNKPENLEMLDYINVYSGKTKIKSINELEYIKGKFYVNLAKDAIAVVNLQMGQSKEL
jgi:glutamine cyclotransferase